MEKDKNQELEKILSELNSNIKKDSRHDTEAAAEGPEEKPAPRRKSAPKPAIKPVEVVAEEAGPTPAEPQPETEAAPAPEAPVEEPREEKKPAPRKSRKRPKKEEREESLREKLEETAEAAGEFIEEERRSFLESARIIEDELGDRELKKPAVRHIAVTAAEVIPEEEAPPPRRRAFDQQKPEEDGDAKPQGIVPGMPRRKRKHMSRRERTTAILGVIVTVFVLIGIVSTVTVGVNLTRNLVNSTAQKEELAKVIFPLVIVDIPEFDTPEALDNSAIIQSSIWAFIIDEQDKSKYPKDDLGAMTVPDADIEPYIRRLYGNDVKIQHQSIDDASVQMLYDSENKRYIIESTPRFLPYTPRVDKISKTGDIYTLTVSYVLPDALWNLEKDHSSATVDKVMEYRLKRNKDTYQMLSVKLLKVTGRSEEGAESGAQNAVSQLPPFEEEDDYLPEETVSSGETASGAESADGDISDGEAADEEDTDSTASEDTSDASDGEDSSGGTESE